MEKDEKQRTIQQNKSLHVFCTNVASALNTGGFSVQVVIKSNMDIDWSMMSVKDLLWRTAQRARLGKESSTALTSKEIDIVYDEVNRFLAQFGVHEAWPSLEEIANQQL